MSSGNAKIGHPAPNFKATAVMPDGQFKDLSLSDYKGKYIVFFFYPLDFTFVCPTEIIAFSDRAEEFKKLNCQVIGASVDSHFCHLAWINTPKKQGGLGPMNIPLVSDPKRTIAQDYGVLKADEGISFRYMPARRLTFHQNYLIDLRDFWRKVGPWSVDSFLLSLLWVFFKILFDRDRAREYKWWWQGCVCVGGCGRGRRRSREPSAGLSLRTLES
uniref:Peroxiredoxin-1 n=1 Tax=Ursus maritimus TaxID=29073 RepID=A0A452VIY6_URSMA